MVTYYELKKVVIPDDKPLLRTASIITCSLCSVVIDGMGGPGNGAICERCAGIVLSGQARSAIVWDD